MKVCSKCNEEKPASEFYPKHDCADGLRAECKECHVITRRKECRERRRKYAEREHITVPLKKKCPRCRQILPFHRFEVDRTSKSGLRSSCKPCGSKAGTLKSKVRDATNNAIRSGRLERPDHCTECNKQCIPEAHHKVYDLDNPLDVVFLCTRCHAKRHRKY